MGELGGLAKIKYLFIVRASRSLFKIFYLLMGHCVPQRPNNQKKEGVNMKYNNLPDYNKMMYLRGYSANQVY